MVFRDAPPAPLASTNGITPRINAIDVMMMGRKRNLRRLQRRLDQVFTPVHPDLGKFHDQDGILGGQSDQRDQPDLRIYVIGKGLVPIVSASNRPESADGNGQHHRRAAPTSSHKAQRERERQR